MKWYSLIFVFCIVVSGCAPQVLITDQEKIKKAPNTDEIRIFQSFDKIEGKYQQIAILETADKRAIFLRDKQGVMNTLCEEAKGIGAEGIVILKKGVGTRISPNPLGGGEFRYEYPTVKAAAVIFLK